MWQSECLALKQVLKLMTEQTGYLFEEGVAHFILRVISECVLAWKNFFLLWPYEKSYRRYSDGGKCQPTFGLTFYKCCGSLI